jgi:hypothetical protein
VAFWLADDIAQGDGTAVSSWVARVGGYNATQGDGSKQPTYRTAGPASQPAVDYVSGDSLAYAAANAISTASAGHVFAVAMVDDTSVNAFIWSSSDEVSGTRFLYGMNALSARLRVGQRNNDVQGVFTSTLTVPEAVPCLLEWSSLDAIYQLAVDNTSDNVGNGDWFGDTSDRDNFTLGGIKTGTFEEQLTDVSISMLLVVDDPITTDERTALNAWVSGKYSIALA